MVSFMLWLGTVGLAMARERRNALPLPNGGWLRSIRAHAEDYMR
jgi:hypothetical protein